MTAIVDSISEQRAWVAQQVAAGNASGIAKLIKAELHKRSGKSWSVKCGRGTSRCWIDIGGYDMTPDQRRELADLLGLSSVHSQGESIPASNAYWRVALARAAFGWSLGFEADPYWD